ncbi:MAG: leucine-rich repeat domain-containing protein [Candidatus Methanomethylophilaceae archaeon]|nr:leucine-rich repeat domain-containing protein [Candidatus Methanomethylophilaceae archaeon]
MRSISIPEGVTSIGENAFSRCSELESIRIPKSVASIGRSTFNSCRNLRTIIIDEDNEHYSFSDRMLLSKDRTILYKFLDPDVLELEIPDGRERIGGYAFSDCHDLRSVTIPDSVRAIDDLAFYGCSELISMDMPENIEDIGEDAFLNCPISKD